MLIPTPSLRIQNVIGAWYPFAQASDWQKMIEGVEAKETGCGPVYELGIRPERPLESHAVADMRNIQFAQPHYHDNGETEIYFVLKGFGRLVVANTVIPVQKGAMVPTPPRTTHYALPDQTEGMVLLVVNTPPFNPRNHVDVVATDASVKYDHDLFQHLTQH